MKTIRMILISIALVSFASCFKADTPTSKPKPTPAAERSAQSSPTPATEKAANFDQAVSDFNAKNFDKAEAGFKDVIAANPKNADAHLYLGRIKTERKDFQAALPYLQEASKLDYKSTEKLMLLGDAYFELKRYDTAIVEYGKISGFEPNNAQATYKMGRTYVGLGNKIAARQQLKKLEPLDKSLAEKLKKEIGD